MSCMRAFLGFITKNGRAGGSQGGNNFKLTQSFSFALDSHLITLTFSPAPCKNSDRPQSIPHLVLYRSLKLDSDDYEIFFLPF